MPLFAVLAAVAPSRAGEITASSGPQDLGTLVNGARSCSSGFCVVTGGTVAGSNRFHRFNAFNTDGFTGVNFETGGASNLIVGVLNGTTFINKPVVLSAPASLFWLSPGGISISGTSGGFSNVTNLTLTTASDLLFSSGGFSPARFHFRDTTAAEVGVLSGPPVRGREGLASNTPLDGIFLQVDGPGAVLTVEENLLLDAKEGTVLINRANLSTPVGSAAGSMEVAGGRVELFGTQITTSGAPISLTGDSRGLRLFGSQVSSDTGNIMVTGTVNVPVSSYAMGIEFNGSAIRSESGSISLSGKGGGPAGGGASGLIIQGLIETRTGNISLSGIGGIDDDSLNYTDGLAGAGGVEVSNSSISSHSGNVTLTGEGGSALSYALGSGSYAKGVLIDRSFVLAGKALNIVGKSLDKVTGDSTEVFGVDIIGETEIAAPLLEVNAYSISPISFRIDQSMILGDGSINGWYNLGGVADVSFSQKRVSLNGNLMPGGDGIGLLAVYANNGGGVMLGPQSSILIDVDEKNFRIADNVSFGWSTGFEPRVQLDGSLQVNVVGKLSNDFSTPAVVSSGKPFLDDFATQTVTLSPTVPSNLRVTSVKSPDQKSYYLHIIHPSTPAPAPILAPAPPPTLSSHTVSGPLSRGSSTVEQTRIALSSPSIPQPPLAAQTAGSPTGEFTPLPGPPAEVRQSVARSEVRLQEASFVYGSDAKWQRSSRSESPGSLAPDGIPAHGTTPAELSRKDPVQEEPRRAQEERPRAAQPSTASGAIPPAKAPTTAAAFAMPPLPQDGGEVPSTVIQRGMGEVTLAFQEAEARAQSETAGKLGLSENPPRTAEEIQEQLLRIQQSIRTSPSR